MDGPRPQTPLRESDVVVLSSDDEDEDERREANEARIEAENRRRLAEAQNRDRLHQDRAGSVPTRRECAPIVPRPAPASLPGRLTPDVTPPPVQDDLEHTPAPRSYQEGSVGVNLLHQARLTNAQTAPPIAANKPREQLRQTSAPPALVEAPVVPPRNVPVPSGRYQQIAPRLRIAMTENMVPILYPLANGSSAQHSRKSSLTSQKSRDADTPGNNEPSTSTAHLRMAQRSTSPEVQPQKINHSPLLLALLTEGPDSSRLVQASSSELTQDFNDIRMERGVSEENLGPVEFSMEDIEPSGENGRASGASEECKDSRASSRMSMNASRSPSRQPTDSRASTENSISSPRIPQAEGEPMEVDTEDIQAPEDQQTSEDVKSTPEEPQNPEDSFKSTSEEPRSVEAASELDTPSPSTTSEPQKRSHKKKPEKMKVVVEPTRKSTRIQGKADAEKKDEEVLDNFKTMEDGFIQDRGIIPPIGLTRRPFHFQERHQEEKADRLKTQLHINMEPVFGQIATTSSSSNTIPAPSTRGTKRPGTPETPPPQLPARRKTLAPPEKKVQARVHPDLYQLKESDMPFLRDAPAPEDEPDRDAAMFIPIEMLDEAERPQTSDWKNAPDLFYNGILTIYWRAIWRQWQGQIDFDTALQHLMQHNYQMLNALDTIDQKLEIVTQEFKPICMAQARALEKQVKADRTEKISLRMLQDKAMRNYHLGEIHNYRYQFNRYYAAQETHGVACNCESILVFDMDCVPRVGCARCTRLLRKPKESERNKRCFICSTYKRLSQGRERPAKHVIFNDREKKFIAEWCRREKVQNRKLSREAVEAQILADDTARWKRQDLTDEEYDMLDERALKISNRDSRGKLSPSEQKIRGEKIAAQLKPFVLPHFTKCQCRNNGGIPRLSKNLNKWEWTKEEQVEWRDLLIEHDGKQDLVGELLKVETELVERFAKVYKNNHELWKGYSYPRIARRYKKPATGLPPIITLGDSNSRDGSPYIPPDEMKTAKRAKKS